MRSRSSPSEPALGTRGGPTDGRLPGSPLRLPFLIAVIVLSTLIGGPALAHGEEGEAEPVDLVEQALAIVVNTPDSMGEAAEKLEAVLEEDPTELAELDMEAVTLALAAVEAGDAHAAEDALIAALGQDPHPEEAAEEPEGVGAAPATTVTSVTETTESPTTGTTMTPAAEPPEAGGAGASEEAVDDGLLSTPLFDHGLTERLGGGFRFPGVAALALALILAVAGTLLLSRRETMR